MTAATPSAARSDRTRTELLRVAEHLYLRDGYDAVSVRAICAAAGANPAAVHYHFGSKDQLTVALLEDRLAPLWDSALERIDPAHDSVSTLVATIVTPLTEVAAEETGHLHLRLLARSVLAHPDAPWTRPWFRLDHWTDVLAQMVDDVGVDEARRRWAMSFELILARFGGDTVPTPKSVASLCHYVVAGLSAPTRGEFS